MKKLRAQAMARVAAGALAAMWIGVACDGDERAEKAAAMEGFMWLIITSRRFEFYKSIGRERLGVIYNCI